MDAISAPDASVNASFLTAMDRLQTILDDTLILMDASDPETDDFSSESLPTSAKAARDFRERAASLLQTSMQRLAYWCSAELRRLPLEGADVNMFLREALRRLAAREDLFHSTMAAFAETRAARWPEAFNMALVVGGPPPTYLPRPIELYAHDALRYVSDMLAWIHQAIASERELVTSLFSLLSIPGRSAPRVLDKPAEPENDLALVISAHGIEPKVLEMLIHRVLDRSMAGCCRPLRKRVQQTISAQRDATLILRLYFVLSFYRITIQHTLGESSPLCVTLNEYVRTHAKLTQGFIILPTLLLSMRCNS